MPTDFDCASHNRSIVLLWDVRSSKLEWRGEVRSRLDRSNLDRTSNELKSIAPSRHDTEKIIRIGLCLDLAPIRMIANLSNTEIIDRFTNAIASPDNQYTNGFTRRCTRQHDRRLVIHNANGLPKPGSRFKESPKTKAHPRMKR